MALPAKLHKVRLTISDLSRHYYQDHSLTVAQHPSETTTRLMVRLLAFMRHADQDLSFTKGLSCDDEPELWLLSPDGRIVLWVELGEPSTKRLKQALSRAEQVVVYSYGGRSATQWWAKYQSELSALSRLTIYHLDDPQPALLAELCARNMELFATLQEREVQLTNGEHSLDVQFQQWR
ncbi:YaeQ family protein [Oceanisphaera pacifica]|uniref:YaeQ family protein n=1 Tax=Oceanisphaera pacifica TaxID=2818389 RepID=A0ABS3ND06_9GAMM|nr:YaeQ family protein [Oceanisphaera pacifica]MBO1518352.1 YaeQ family protein [Oceanisphaera pacifica]